LFRRRAVVCDGRPQERLVHLQPARGPAVRAEDRRHLQRDRAGTALAIDPGARHRDQCAGPVRDLAGDARHRRIRPAHLPGAGGAGPAGGGIAAGHERDRLMGRAGALTMRPRASINPGFGLVFWRELRWLRRRPFLLALTTILPLALMALLT